MTDPLLRYESPSLDAPFKRSAEEIAELYFSQADITKIGQFTVISENDVNYILIQELKIFSDENKSGLYETGEVVFQNYNLMIFVSKDVSYLQSAFENSDPAPGDVCIFLEDNSTDTFSGKSAWKMEGYSDIVVGPKVRNELEQWFVRGHNSTFRQLTGLEEQLGLELDLSRRELKQLIENGELKNATRTFAIGLFQFLNGLNILAAPLYSSIGNLILSATHGLRRYIKFQDYHWDPAAQIPVGDQGEMQANPDFTPILLPFSNQTLEKLAELEASSIETVADMLQKQLLKEQANIKARLDQFSKTKAAGIVVPENVIACLETCAGYINEMIDLLVETCSRAIPLFSALGIKWLNALNAFYCGLWNSLVEAILGLVDLVGYYFVVLGAIGDATADAQTLLPQAYELLDEAIQTILQADIVGILSEAIHALVEGVSNFNLYSLTGSISIEKVAYFVGGVIGFVVEIFVGAYWSGGIEAVRAAILKFGKVGEDIFTFMTSGIQRTMGNVLEFSIESMMSLVVKILALIKAGKEKVGEVIRSLFRALENAAELADDVVEMIKRLLQLTETETALLDELGLKFVKYQNNLCSVCNVVS